MLTFISCAKTMTEKAANAPFSLTEPQFLPQAREIALRCASLSADDLDACFVSTRSWQP